MVSNWVHDLDNEEAIESLNIKEAIEIIADAWNNVKPATIKNCWQHTKILPETTSEMVTAEEYVELDSNLISASLPTEEEILEEFLVDG